MNSGVRRLLFLAGGLFIFIGAVFLFKGSTQVEIAVSNCISIAGLFLGLAQLLFRMPIFSPNGSSHNDNVQHPPQNAPVSPLLRIYTTTNSRISAPPHVLIKADQIFFLICLISIPIITFIKLLNFTDIPSLLLTIVALSALAGVGFSSLVFIITPPHIEKSSDTTSVPLESVDLGAVVAVGLTAFILFIIISVVFLILFLTVGPNQVTLTCFLLAGIFCFFYSSFSSFIEKGHGKVLFVTLSLTTVLIFSDLLFVVLASNTHFFMTVNPKGTFIVSSFSLLAPRADLVFLTATIFLTLGVVGICASTKAILGSMCGGAALVFGVILLLSQTTPMFVAVAIINCLMGVIMFIFARRR